MLNRFGSVPEFPAGQFLGVAQANMSSDGWGVGLWFFSVEFTRIFLQILEMPIQPHPL